VWGGHQLSGYAAKAWSGLIRDFYVPRWTYFFENMRRKDRGEKEVNILDWDLEWVEKEGVSSVTEPVDDPVKEARRLMKKYGGKLIAIEWQKLGTLEGSEISSKFKPLEWDATSFVDGAGRYNVQFYREWGYNSLEIEWVALIENGKEIARDKHLGRASRRSRNNIYRLDMNEFKDGVKYIIRASVRGEDETIIHGGVSIRKSKLPEKTPAEQGKQAS